MQTKAIFIFLPHPILTSLVARFAQFSLGIHAGLDVTPGLICACYVVVIFAHCSPPSLLRRFGLARHIQVIDAGYHPAAVPAVNNVGIKATLGGRDVNEVERACVCSVRASMWKRAAGIAVHSWRCYVFPTTSCKLQKRGQAGANRAHACFSRTLGSGLQLLVRQRN